MGLVTGGYLFGLSLIDSYACKAWIYILLGNIAEAEKYLKEVDRALPEIDAVPIQVSNYYRIKLEFDLYRLRESPKTGFKSKTAHCRKRAKKTGKTLRKITKRAAQHRIESYKLTGVYY